MNNDTKENTMKVTRLIREYVEKNVTALSKKSQEEIDFDIYKDKVALAEKYIEEQTKEFADKLKADVLARFDLPECAIGYYTGRALTLSRSGNKIERKAIEAKRIRDQKTRDKIDEILLNLELGATRAELDKMIAELQQESIEN